MMKNLLIIGSGGHGRVIADYAEQLNTYEYISFLDESYGINNTNGAWQVVGKEDDWTSFLPQADFIVAYSDNAKRHKLLSKLLQAKASVINIIHPSASVSSHVTLGAGIVVAANAVINFGCEISNGVIINTGACIDHDCVVGDAVHISPGTHIAGSVEVGKYSWIGIGASVVECIKIAPNTKVGAGGVICKDTKPDTLYVGVPAIPVKPLDPII